jgi:methylase of polypeptide subunit release factors
MNRKDFLAKYDKDSRESIAEVNKIKKPYHVRINGIRLCIFPQVFDPTWRLSSKSLLNTIKINEGDKVLDIGTGSGILSIFAIKKGASKAVGVDISKPALECAKFNVKLNKMSNKITIKASNLFSNAGNQKFDVILFNSPQRTIKPKTTLEKAFFDYKMRTISSFISNAKKFLNKNGRIYISYGKAGEMEKLEKLIKIKGYKMRILKKFKLGIRLYVVYELALK